MSKSVTHNGFVVPFPVIILCEWSLDALRKIMYLADQMGMVNKEYVYISYGMVSTIKNENPWIMNTEGGNITEFPRKAIFNIFKQVPA